MPNETDIEKRNRAILAFALLSGARDDAMASLAIRHVDLVARTVFQDARSVRTKLRKTFTSCFFPVGDDIEAIVADWIAHLTGTLHFGPDDPLFPKTRVAIGAALQFEAAGLEPSFWSNAGQIRKVFHDAFAMAGLPYFNPHSIRKTLVRLDATYAVRMIGDIIPNPFVAREIVGRVLERLGARGFDAAKIGGLAGTIIEQLWRGLENARDMMAEKLFRERVASGRVQFRLRLDGNNWRMPFAFEARWPHEPRLLTGNDLKPVKKSLFDLMLANDFNGEERSVAVQLDGEAAVKWWHRNVARTQYPIQGWRRHKIYPDFIFAVARQNGASKIVVLETKGEQLNNPDTAYKRSMLELVSKHFAWDDTATAGTLELVRKDGDMLECQLVLMPDIPTELPKLTS